MMVKKTSLTYSDYVKGIKHPTARPATFVPEIGGGVVVASHVNGIKVGDVKLTS